MSQDFDLKSRFLTRHSHVLKRMLSEGEIDAGNFLAQGLLELLEAIKNGGIEGEIFNSKDVRYHEALIFIKSSYPDLNTDAYENAYENMISNYLDGVKKRTEGEKEESLKRCMERDFFDKPLKYKQPVKVLA